MRLRTIWTTVAVLLLAPAAVRAQDDYDFANKLADVAGFEQRKAASAAKGLLRGIGYSS